MISKQPESSAEMQIAAEIAHEIRNPLALIKANLQYVELCDEGGPNKKNYDIIYREIDRINDILYCYMDCAKKDGLSLRRFGISELIREVEQIFAKACACSGISLIVSVENEGMEVKGDYNKIKQVLVNIVQNAKESVEAAKRKSGKIKISAFIEEGCACVCVSDNGLGIREGDLRLIGTPFFTKKENGCGLGISISKEIIKLHKGNLSIRAAENKGAAVMVSLPLYNSGCQC